MLELSGVSKRYSREWGRGTVEALQPFDLSVTAGEVVGLLGPNGSGKSTALKIALGLTRPDEGKGTVGAFPLGAPAARRRTGYLPEKGGLSPHLTAAETLESWRALAGEGVTAGASAVSAWLERVGLAKDADRRVGTFSKGMRQRLGMAQALMLEPDLLVLDEPFSGVDPIGVDLLIGLIRAQADRGAAVVLSSHLLHRVEEVCDRVVFLEQGRVLARGAVRELLAPGAGRPAGLEDLYRQLLGKETRK